MSFNGLVSASVMVQPEMLAPAGLESQQQEYDLGISLDLAKHVDLWC